MKSGKEHIARTKQEKFERQPLFRAWLVKKTGLLPIDFRQKGRTVKQLAEYYIEYRTERMKQYEK